MGEFVMRNRICRWTLCVLILVLFNAALSAQALRGSYFAENATLRNRLNPAMVPANNYLGLPVVGNLGVAVNSNLGVVNFLFPSNGQLLTFMHPEVSAQQFLSQLPSNPYLNLEVDTDLLNFGFRTGERS